MKLLFVTTVPLLPMNDGVRIPAANHLNALKEAYDVDLLLLDRTDKPAEAREVEDTQSLVSRFSVVSVSRMPRQKAVLREIVYAEPFFGALDFDGPLPGWVKSEVYDCVWCATAPAVGMFALPHVRDRLDAKKYIAGLSDMHSLVVLRQAEEASKADSLYYKTISRIKLWLRSKVLLRSEREMLKHFDLVTMQTCKEYDWVERHFGDVAQKSLILPNGVSSELFDMPITRGSASLLFVGALYGVYGQRLEWFIRRVWCVIRDTQPGVSMHVVGKGASSELRALFERESIVYQSYVESIEDEYARHAILVAPIFKGFGIINKVVEAMAAGCIVVGDQTAFNGIESFQSGKHGRIANDGADFIHEISSILSSEDFCENERSEGRSLIYEQFNWETRYSKVKENVSRLCREL